MQPNWAYMLIFSLVLLSVGPANAGPAKPVVIDRDIAGELVLPKTKQPHQVATSITVRPTAKLRIERGAKMSVAGGAIITLMADIEVFGDGDEKVGFGPRDRHRPWGGFRVAENEEVKLSDLLVVGADTGVATAGRTKLKMSDSVVKLCENGLELNTGRHELENCLVASCAKAGVVGNYSFLTFDRCTFERCGEAGINLRGKVSMTATDCVVSDNDVNLITSLSTGREISKLVRCSILRPKTMNVRHQNSQPLHARGCFWGTNDPRLISRSIEDGYDKPARGQVDFAEFITDAP